MRVELGGKTCKVTREPQDKPMRRGGWGTRDSTFFYNVARELKKQGHDVIRRRTQADGHMFGNEQTHYVRERRWGFAVYDPNWALTDDAVADFNAGRTVTLLVERWKGGRA